VRRTSGAGEAIAGQAALNHSGFTTEESTAGAKLAVLIYGYKGTGKTALAFAAPGVIACFSYDGKSMRIKENPKLFSNDDRIHIWDVTPVFDKSSEKAFKESSGQAVEYVYYLLKHMEDKVKPDWIVHDGSEILQKCCEMQMRIQKNLAPFAGTPNRNVWKLRNLIIDHIHLQSMRIAKKGVIYTTYVNLKEIMKADGTEVKDEHPKWIGEIETATDIVIRMNAAATQRRGRRFFAYIESNKEGGEEAEEGKTAELWLPTGEKYDVTGLDALEAFWRKP
jgi:hypothetical protein